MTPGNYKRNRANWSFAYVTPGVGSYDSRVVYRSALRVSCKRCQRIRNPDERFSVRGLCRSCADRAMVETKHQLQAKKGPRFEHWYEEMRLRFEHQRLDDLPSDE